MHRPDAGTYGHPSVQIKPERKAANVVASGWRRTLQLQPARQEGRRLSRVSPPGAIIASSGQRIIFSRSDGAPWHRTAPAFRASPRAGSAYAESSGTSAAPSDGVVLPSPGRCLRSKTMQYWTNRNCQKLNYRLVSLTGKLTRSPELVYRMYSHYSGYTTHYSATTLLIRAYAMILLQSADVLEVTGLTRSQLREWTGRGRRELILPDVEPAGPGRHALYAWQTLLVLRVLLVLNNEYAAEVGAWASAARNLRQKLERISFPSLWHLSAYFPNCDTALLVDDISMIGSSGLVLPLEPHLTVLASKLSLPRPAQLTLFPPMAVSQ